MEYLIKNLPAVLCEMTNQTIYSFDLSFRRLLLVIMHICFQIHLFQKTCRIYTKRKKGNWTNFAPPGRSNFSIFLGKLAKPDIGSGYVSSCIYRVALQKIAQLILYVIERNFLLLYFFKIGKVNAYISFSSGL